MKELSDKKRHPLMSAVYKLWEKLVTANQFS